MAILLENTDIECEVIDRAQRQPTRTSKTAMAEAILQRALRETPDWLDAWLRSEPAQANVTPAPAA